LVEVKKMFIIPSTGLFGIFVVAIVWALVSYSDKKKLKKLETEMREKGVDEETIIIARHFFRN